MVVLAPPDRSATPATVNPCTPPWARISRVALRMAWLVADLLGRPGPGRRGSWNTRLAFTISNYETQRFVSAQTIGNEVNGGSRHEYCLEAVARLRHDGLRGRSLRDPSRLR